MDHSPPESATAGPKTARDLDIMVGHPPPPEKRPTLENWDHPPFNRWSFQNVRALLPTAEVYRGTGHVRRLETEAQDLDDVVFDSVDGSSKSVSRMLADTYTDGFAVLHRGRLVYERYFNGMDPRTQHLSQSVAKSVVGIVCGILAGRGILDTRAPLVDYVPELARCGYADARLQHVLDMSSGVRFSEDYTARDSDMARMDIASGWRPQRADGPALTIRDLILSLPKVREHGEVFEYRSVECDVIAWVLERATGLSLADLVGRELWQHLGVERDAYFTVDTAGTALANGGFNATLRDYARFGQMVTDGGRVLGQEVVPAGWITRCRSGDSSRFQSPYTAISPRGAYSNQWWVHDPGRGDIMARGVFGQLVYSDPYADLTVVKLSAWPDYLIQSFTLDTLRAIDALRDALGG